MYHFKVKKICCDGYERWIKVENYNVNNEYWLHFIEFDEYIENNEISKKLKVGDIIKGTIKIDLVTNYEIVSTDSRFIQPIDNSSHVIAIGKIIKIIDNNTLILNVNELSENICVEFEIDININIGENIKISGSLEFEMD